MKKSINKIILLFIFFFIFPFVAKAGTANISITGGSVYVGEDVTIPLTFEYCLNNTTGNNSHPISMVKKSIYFDLKDSLFIDPKNYLVEITINSNYSSTNNSYNNNMEPIGKE